MATAIVYHRTSGIIRRIIHTDDATTLPDHVQYDWEAILSVSDAILVPDQNGNLSPSLDLAYKALQAATGLVPEAARCLVIDGQGNVVNVIMADPLVDSVPGCTLFQDENGGIGYTPDENGDFTIPAPGQSVDAPPPPPDPVTS